MIPKLKSLRDSWSTNSKRIYKKATGFITQRPGSSFFGIFGVLFVLILIGNFLRRPPKPKDVEIPVKDVKVVSVGSAPQIKVQGRVEKSGIVKLIAQSPGIVQKIYVTEGNTVERGTSLFWLSTNYQGGTLATSTRQIAQKNAEFTKDTLETQKDLIAKRKELAQKLDTQSEELRDITDKSLDDTRSLVSLNEEILRTLDTQLSTLTANNPGGINDMLILELKQGKTQALAGLTTLRSGLRTTEFQSNDEKTPAGISHLEKDLTLKQLELEDKSLILAKDLADLNLRVTQITEALMYPVSPVPGVVERIHVTLGQSVNPGTPLATIKANKNEGTIVVLVSADLARTLSTLKNCQVHIGEATYMLSPRAVSVEATEGAFNTVLFTLPEEASGKIEQGETVVVELPLGNAHTSSALPFIPLDALYQTQTSSYVFVAQKSGEDYLVKTREVRLGQVFGDLVEVKEGISSGDQVIVTRTVVAGDKVKF